MEVRPELPWVRLGLWQAVLPEGRRYLRRLGQAESEPLLCQELQAHPELRMAVASGFEIGAARLIAQRAR